MGSSASASIAMPRSYTAPSSVASCFQRATETSHSDALGACGRPHRYWKVTSSGVIRPARAPPSMDMLHTVIRSSMLNARMALPVNSKTQPVPPPTPMRAIRARMMSLAVTPGRRRPSTRTSNDCDLRCKRHCVASTCSTSLVPMPKASAPNAPCVAVWLSPQTTVMPGCVRPSSGPITWTHALPVAADAQAPDTELGAVGFEFL